MFARNSDSTNIKKTTPTKHALNFIYCCNKIKEIWFTLKIERKANSPESECLLLAITKGVKHHKPSASGWRVETHSPFIQGCSPCYPELH
jgi:hypothetical protein